MNFFEQLASINIKENHSVFLKKILNSDESELYASEDIKSQNIGYKLKVINHPIGTPTNSIFLDNAIKLFQKNHTNLFSQTQINELREELFKIPFGSFHVILLAEKNTENYFYIGVYCILSFLKNTRYVLDHLEDKQRYHHSRLKKDVIEKTLKTLENIKTNVFLQPKSTFEIGIIDKKEKLLNLVDEHYQVIIALIHSIKPFGTKNMFIDPEMEESMNDVIELLNAITISEREALKSLSILFYKMLEQYLDSMTLELFIQNILRIFFEKEIKQLNERSPEILKDTFLIDSKQYKNKNVYIHSTFDNVSIYGMNRENKYFFYRKVSVKNLMKIYIGSIKLAIPTFDLKLSFYKQIRRQFQHPYIHEMQGVYPEFFDNPSYMNAPNLARTFFSESKKYAPDELLKN